MKKYHLLPLMSVLLIVFSLNCASKNEDEDKVTTSYIYIKTDESDISDLFFTGSEGEYVVEIESNEKLHAIDNKGWGEVPLVSEVSSLKNYFK